MNKKVGFSFGFSRYRKKKIQNGYVMFGFPAHPWGLQSATIEWRSEKLQKFRLFSI